MKYKLIGSANNLDKLRDLIIKNMYWSIAEFNQVSDKEWTVSNLKGIMPYRIILAKGRYRFEEAI